jgi:hypothetical protein
MAMAEMAEINIEHHAFHGEWNYTIRRCRSLDRHLSRVRYIVSKPGDLRSTGAPGATAPPAHDMRQPSQAKRILDRRGGTNGLT